MNIKPITTITEDHFSLLLSADPSRKIVTDYLQRGFCFEKRTATNKLIGVLVLLPTRPETIEIVNIAIDEQYQAQGFGKELLEFALRFSKEENYKSVEIGTGSTSFGQLYLYQKCGFRMVSIDTDFFTRHYETDIIENRLILKDMVRLRLDF
ncbi:GNAT family N-acetyltransferase [Enterococcus sp. LJL99]